MVFGLEIWVYAVVVAVYLLGGYVKGAIGFALPMIAVAGGATVLDAQTAVAAVILPALFANIFQAFREGAGALLSVLKRFWPGIAVIMVMIVLSAPLLVWLPEWAIFLTLGVGVGLFAIIQLLGWRPTISPERERPISLGIGVISGFYGGVAGMWGPAYILFLTALKLPKAEHVRAAGACFLAGGIIITPAHAATGILTGERLYLSLTLIPVAYLGMALGQRLQDRLDPEVFRKVTLIVLVLSAINLLRRSAFG